MTARSHTHEANPAPSEDEGVDRVRRLYLITTSGIPFVVPKTWTAPTWAAAYTIARSAVRKYLDGKVFITTPRGTKLRIHKNGWSRV